jgi:ATP-binding cassette subfamily B (MDR/TAP) protein 1
MFLWLDKPYYFIQVGKFIQLLSTFFGGFAIAFVQGWLLTLVMLSSIPLIVIAGAAMSIMISRKASLGQTAYAKAAIVVEQTLGSIRTVCLRTKNLVAFSSLSSFKTQMK